MQWCGVVRKGLEADQITAIQMRKMFQISQVKNVSDISGDSLSVRHSMAMMSTTSTAPVHHSTLMLIT